MKYHELQTRAIAMMNKDNLGVFMPDWVNEARDDLGLIYPFSFLLTTKEISVVSSTYSYAFDAADANNRYSGLYDSIVYDNAGAKKKLSFADTKLFDRLYPTPAVGEPNIYTVRGESFTVEQIPSTITSKKFLARYYRLPKKLSGDSDEEYIDKKYYKAILALVCLESAKYLAGDSTDQGAIALVGRWENEALKEVLKMVGQDKGVSVIDTALREKIVSFILGNPRVSAQQI